MIRHTLLAIAVAGFLIGTTTHTAQLISGGWLPYTFAPLWMNAYWTALTFLDPTAALLLMFVRRWGVGVGIAIIVSDVIINSIFAHTHGDGFIAPALQLQSLFCGFMLGAGSALWRSGDPATTLDERRIV